MRPALSAPPALLDAIQAYRQRTGFKLRTLAEARVELAAMFSGRRPLRPGYMADRRLRAAYVCYYVPINYAVTRIVLDELAGYAGTLDGPALDYGCGPGSAALAWGRPEIDLFDVVDEALDDADFLLRSMIPGARPQLRSEDPTGRYRIVFAANVLAEMSSAAPLRALLDERLEPDGYLVVIEPALKKTTQRLMEWRDELAGAGFRIAAPCLGIARCPMRSNDAMWCHQDFPWTRPPLVDEIDRRTGIAHESLQYSYLVVTRRGPTLAERSAAPWRMVSNLHRSKGKVWGFLCGRDGPICRTELLTRHRAPERAALERARRGDLLSFDPPISGASARLTEQSRVERL